MQVLERSRRLSQIYLSSIPFLIFFVLIWFHALRTPVVYPAVVGLLVTANTVAAWKLGARAFGSESEERRGLALAGILLLAPWAVITFLVGMRTPWQATEAENQIRYAVLLIAGILVAGGFVVLKEKLMGADERFYSTLGFAAIMLASPLAIIWNTFALTARPIAFHQQASSGQIPDWAVPLQSLFRFVLADEVVLTYLATAAFSVALARTGWLGRKTSRVFAGISLFAVLCLAITTAVFIRSPLDPEAFVKSKIANAGFVFAIPALRLIIPYLIGVNLLRRAGDE